MPDHGARPGLDRAETVLRRVGAVLAGSSALSLAPGLARVVASSGRTVGALGLYRTWTTLLFVAQLPVLLVRARLEEEALQAEFGATWQAYRDEVPRWRPKSLATLLGRRDYSPGAPGSSEVDWTAR